MIAAAAMEVNTKSAFIRQPEASIKLDWKHLSIAELYPCTSHLPYGRRHRLIPTRAEDEGSGRPKASSPMPEPERRRRSNYADPDKPDNVSVWDSNAEGIRGKWRVRDNPALGSRPVEGSFNANASNPEDTWQWWRSGPDDDEYTIDDDDDDDDEEDSWFGLESFDISSAISMLRWMLPAAALILPWFFGGPMFLMAAFAFFPFVRRLFGAAFQGWNGSSKSRRRNAKKAGFWQQSDSSIDSREDSEFFNSDVEDWETSLLRSSLNREPNSKLGGWVDDNEKVIIQKKARKAKKKVALERRWNKKEMPLLFRLLVALFPFLRSWGGFL